jgi:hypothetical protein
MNLQVPAARAGAYFRRPAVTGYVASVLPAGLITVFVTCMFGIRPIAPCCRDWAGLGWAVARSWAVARI